MHSVLPEWCLLGAFANIRWPYYNICVPRLARIGGLSFIDFSGSEAWRAGMVKRHFQMFVGPTHKSMFSELGSLIFICFLGSEAWGASLLRALLKFVGGSVSV